ncbi:potassium/proton antiporter [Nocardioides sp. SYSU D00038]|uniref:potassium/proton antiporter n=1 Tax=Nocardioides sp. SYSU D00038 TaxID=2812554 RepID=UPI0019679E15|nr:potassium/proton antiporter [Nocardioides sp. SYSU D00038]
MDPADLNGVLLGGTIVLLAAVAAVRLSSRAGLPSLLVYLAIGLVIGEAGLGLEFEDPDLTQVLGTVALAVILAEGGFTTDWRVIRPVAPLAGVLATLGVAVSVAVTSAAVHLVLDVDLRTAVLLGAVASSTDAAAVFAALRTMPVKGRLRATVEAESGFNDPPVIILVTVVTSDAWGAASPLGIGLQVGWQLVAGVAVGFSVAWAGRWLLVRSALPSAGLYPIAMVGIVFLAFAVAGTAAASGLMAVYVAGLTLGNADLPHRGAAAGFVEGLAWLAQIGLFVLLGLLASPGRLLEALPWALLVGGVLTLVARPLSVAISATPFGVPWREQAFISWAGLRGAVPIVLATIPMSVGLPSATRVFDVVFLLVVVFTLVQGPTLPWVARRTGATAAAQPLGLAVESAPLDELGASLLQFRVPHDSRLAGVEISELRLPAGAAVSLVVRHGEASVPSPTTELRPGDQVLVVAPRGDRAAIERRIRAVSDSGRLAGWYAEPPTGAAS